jgi:hypothetical protein
MRAKTHVHNRSLESIDVDRLQCGMPAAGEGAEAARPFWRRWSTLLQVFNESARDSTVTLWAIVVACAPLFYVLVVTLPRPLGLGLQWGNDFPDHRIWWTQVETFFWSHGFFPQWNPTVDLGYPYMASAFGTGALYPLRWWTYLPTYFGGFWSYVAQYVQVIFHASLALLGILLS